MSEARQRSEIDVLVVDDDAIMRDLMADWLEAAGYTVRKVGDCRAASGACPDGPPALVISDMWMPGPCGADAIRALRERHPQMQVVAVSGHFGSGQGCSPQDALAAGAARALAKPVKRAQLLATVAELIGPAK